jgi:hypothetical protein
MHVTIAHLRDVPDGKIYPTLSSPLKESLLALTTALSSLCGCALCGYYHDWFCFSMILLGIVASGLSWLTIGSLTLIFTHPTPAGGVPEGGGIMKSGSEIVILCGKEKDVNSVTRGRFSFKTQDSDPNYRPEYRSIGISAMLLMLQFLAQLLLIPQGTLFGQIVFLSTLAVSWVFNSYLSSTDRDTTQREALLKAVWNHLEMRRFKFRTWTSATVFTLLHAWKEQSPEIRKLEAARGAPALRVLLDYLMPNNTTVWQRWKDWALLNIEVTHGDPNFADKGPKYLGLNNDEINLLSHLVEDAKNAHTTFNLVQ